MTVPRPVPFCLSLSTRAKSTGCDLRIMLAKVGNNIDGQSKLLLVFALVMAILALFGEMLNDG